MIKAEQISFSYLNSPPVLDNVSFTAQKGQITALIGTNGTGKTTLLRAVCGLLPCEGNVSIDGASLSQFKNSGRISYLEQDNSCSAELTVFEVVLLGRMKHLGFRVGPEDTEAVSQVIDLMNIAQYADRNIYELSGGQRQLVFIAQALVREPQVLALDEPTSALDLHHQFRLMKLLRELTIQNGYTTVMSIHHLDMVLNFADQVVILDRGQVYAQGPPQDLLSADMMEEIYQVSAETYCDKQGGNHIIPISAIEF